MPACVPAPVLVWPALTNFVLPNFAAVAAAEPWFENKAATAAFERYHMGTFRASLAASVGRFLACTSGSLASPHLPLDWTRPSSSNRRRGIEGLGFGGLKNYECRLLKTSQLDSSFCGRHNLHRYHRFALHLVGVLSAPRGHRATAKLRVV